MPDTRIRSFLWIKSDREEEKKRSLGEAPVFIDVGKDWEQDL